MSTHSFITGFPVSKKLPTPQEIDGSISINGVISYDFCLDGASEINVEGAATIFGVIDCGGPLEKTGAGKLTLSATNTYYVNSSGSFDYPSTIITAGTISVSSAENLGDVDGIVSFNGGTLEITGTSMTSLGHPAKVNAAKNVTISVVESENAFTLSLGLAMTTGSLTKLGAGTLILTGTSTYTGTTTISAGALKVGAGSTVGSIGSGAVTNNAALIFNRSGTVTVANNISGTGSVEMIGTANITFSGSSSFTGAFTMSAGTAYVASSANMGAGGVVFNGGGIRVSGTTFNDFGVRDVTFAQGKLVAVEISDAGNSFTISANMNQGSGGLTKTGAGELILTGSNSFYGTVTLSAGKLSVAKHRNLGALSPLVLNGGTLKITGTEIRELSAGTIGDHAVTLTSGQTLSLEIADAANTFTISDALTHGSGGLTKTGSGILVLAATNTYSGTTTITAGTIQIGDGATSGTLGSGAVVNNSALIFNRSDSVTATNAISGTGTFKKYGAGVLTISALSGTQTVSIEAGTLTLTASFCGAVTIQGGATFVANGTDTGSVVVKQVVTGIGAGTLRPIDLAITGDITFEAASILTANFNSDALTADAITVSGNLNIGTGAILNFSDTGSSPASVIGIPIPLITYSGAWNSVIFAGKTNGGTFSSGGVTYQINYNVGGVLTLTVISVP